MATPTYKGAGQPAGNTGWLSGIGSSFGTAAPAYGVAPQAAGTAAAASTAPTAAPVVFIACEPDRIVFVIPRELIDVQKLAESAVQVGAVPSCDGDRITLVIPRQ